MKKLISILSIVAIGFITSCDEQEIKPVDPVVIIKDTTVIVSPNVSLNISHNDGGKYDAVSSPSEILVSFTPYENYEVKEVFENEISLGKIKSYSYKKNKDVKLEIIFDLNPQAAKLINTSWRIYQAYDTSFVTKEINYFHLSDVYLTQTLKFRADGKYEVNISGNVTVYNWRFMNEEKTLMYLGPDLIKIKYIEDKILIGETAFYSPTNTVIVKYYNTKYPKPN